MYRWLRKTAEARGITVKQVVIELLRAAADWSLKGTMARNKRLYQEAFWLRFRGTWAEQCLFRIPAEERDKWIITDTSRWDEGET